MLQDGEGSPDGESLPKMFLGVRFLLLGFDGDEEAKIRSKLVDGGGVDAGEYGPSCTHVIVDKIVYDDTRCVMARRDGKTVVTALWVDHCFDIGMSVDASLVLYRPVKDLNGIPGAKSFIVCLTGYQRQDREDIMRMVGLMGAHFSKPLVANKVTHLICYKFEGEKYELAKKISTIKLVNHRWLEDCLKEWEVLPECRYDKSGHEIEILEAEAKDSEDELEENKDMKQYGLQKVAESPNMQRGCTSGSKVSGVPVSAVSEVHQNPYVVKGSSITEDVSPEKTISVNAGKEIQSAKKPVLHENDNGLQDYLETGADIGNAINGGVFSSHGKTPNSRNRVELPSYQTTGKRLFQSDATNAKSLSYSRKTLKTSPVSLFSKEHSSYLHTPQGHFEQQNSDSTLSKSDQLKNSLEFEFDQIENMKNDSGLHDAQVKDGMVPQKRKFALAGTSSRSPKKQSPMSTNCTTGTSATGKPEASTIVSAQIESSGVSANGRREELMVGAAQIKPSPSSGNSCQPRNVNTLESPYAKLSNIQSSNINAESLKCGLPLSRNTISDNTESPFSTKGSTPETPCNELRHPSLAAEPDDGGGVLRRSYQDSSSSKSHCETERSRSPATLSIHKVEKDGTSSRSGAKKEMVSKRSLGSKRKPGFGSGKDSKGSLNVNNMTTASEATICFKDDKPAAEHKNVSSSTKTEMVAPTLRSDEVMEEKVGAALCSAGVIVNKGVSVDDETESPEEHNVETFIREPVTEPISNGNLDKKLETLQYAGNVLKVDSVCIGNETVISGEDRVNTKLESVKRTDNGSRLTDEVDQVDELLQEVECPSSSTKRNALSTKREAENFMKDNDAAELDKRINDEKLEKTERQQHPAGIPKKPILVNETEKNKTEIPVNKEEGMCKSSRTNKSPHSARRGKETSLHDKGGEELDSTNNDENQKTEALHPEGTPKKAANESGKSIDVTDNEKTFDNGGPSVITGKYFRKKVVSKKLRPMKDKKVVGPTDGDSVQINGECTTSMKSEKCSLEICQGGKEVEVENKEMKKDKSKGVRKTVGKATSASMTDNLVDADKENKPVKNGGPNGKSDKHGKKKGTVKCRRIPMQNNTIDAGTDSNRMQTGKDLSIARSEPVWFILSGHRLQRKEFQQVIKRLKGRVCRDSHHWSYQATHFVVPDPVRRTEKFFAAAASGRWILKTDYLSASNQAGKFLAEESYEWFKNGLSEDGSINLEAPRKWRLLRERTGHGAFYGMRIIIYGECIAPPLDTLKRAVKAGDGTIVATSPPYTRLLTSGIDFAIVSPGMPCVDMWVQEFIRHEIPCVMADYLVEYVCKPGSSLDRHILYNTHALAEKSFANLQSRLNEVAEVSTPSDDVTSLMCQACGSRDRGDVMLICGDESGSVGCGIGTHIDCCVPPLEAVPEEDWFCPKCSNSRNTKTSSKITKKGSTVLRRKS